jgi:EAL domain-containing protein (putative c-di-GMP-specific phosphodiesterase class I)
MQMMDEGLQQDVIKLWIAMPKNTRKKILETIETPEELDRLHEMHLLMLKGYPDRPEVEAAIRELEEVESSDI